MLTAEILFSAVSRSLNSKFMSVLKAIGLNAIDGAMDLGFNYLSQRIGVGNQKELMDYGYEQQKDFWNRQNAYNDPSSQIVRLRAAGLNPAMLNGNSINNTAGGLSSISAPSAPQGIQPHSDVTAAMQGLSSLLTDEKQRGLLSVQTQKMGEEILNLWVEREYKQIMNRLGLTEAEMKEMEKEAMFEAYYGTGLDGGAPRIKNNPIKINMDKTLADLDASTAAAEYSRALKDSEEQFRQYRIEFMEAQTEAEREKAKESMANAVRAYAEADFARAEKTYLRHKNSREAAQHQMNLTIDRLRKQGMISENEVAEYKAKIDRAWDEGFFGDDAKGHRLENLATMWNSFLHHNLNLSGAATKVVK